MKKRGLCEATRFFRKFFRSFSYFVPIFELVVQPLANSTGLLGLCGVVTTLLSFSFPFRNAECEFPRFPGLSPSLMLAFFLPLGGF